MEPLHWYEGLGDVYRVHGTMLNCDKGKEMKEQG